MPSHSPATRAALAVFVLVTALIAAVTALAVAERTESAEAVAKERLVAVSATIAAFVDSPGLDSPDRRLRGGADSRLATLAEENDLAGIAILHRRGGLLAASDPTGLQQINWPAVVAETGISASVLTASWNGADYFLAVNPAVSGDLVAVLRATEDVHAAARADARRIAIGAVLAWLLIGMSLAALSSYAGKRTVHRMEALAKRLAGIDRFDDDTARHQVEMARSSLGTLADPFDVMADALKSGYECNVEARSHIAALFQINPHYVLLCTLDGHIVDANPAFYAMTGLPFEAVRGQRIEALNEVMPIEPLFELARRSLRENSSISGIEYALVNHDEVRRTVQVSLRGVSVEGKPGVIIQATDVANQRNLEHQISTFNDALDLMVDQRVAQLTAGNTSIGRLLDEAGVVLASFDAGGSTRRWNRATQDITGRTIQQVPHFTAFVSVLGLAGKEKEQFNRWFWGPSEGSYPMEVYSAEGPVRRILWRKSVGAEGGKAEDRVLLGMDLPRQSQPTGDGLGGISPGMTRVLGAVAHSA